MTVADIFSKILTNARYLKEDRQVPKISGPRPKSESETFLDIFEPRFLDIHGEVTWSRTPEIRAKAGRLVLMLNNNESIKDFLDFLFFHYRELQKYFEVKALDINFLSTHTVFALIQTFKSQGRVPEPRNRKNKYADVSNREASLEEYHE